jgi:two-component system, cell cycle response regulator DivK
MSKRILVVEDQLDNRQIIRDMLAPTDYEITAAENGEEALAAIAKQRPDLILMGIQLPIMDGYEVTRQIKADPAMRSIPIIAVTSHALEGEEQTARAAGCDGYVPEPYSPGTTTGTKDLEKIEIHAAGNVPKMAQSRTVLRKSRSIRRSFRTSSAALYVEAIRTLSQRLALRW